MLDRLNSDFLKSIDEDATYSFGIDKDFLARWQDWRHAHGKDGCPADIGALVLVIGNNTQGKCLISVVEAQTKAGASLAALIEPRAIHIFKKYVAGEELFWLYIGTAKPYKQAVPSAHSTEIITGTCVT